MWFYCHCECRYLVPADLTVGQFVYVVRKRIKLSPEKAIFVFVKNTLPPTGELKLLPFPATKIHSCIPLQWLIWLWMCLHVSASLMSAIYDENKDEDGFLYMTYSGENTFGSVQWYTKLCIYITQVMMYILTKFFLLVTLNQDVCLCLHSVGIRMHGIEVSGTYWCWRWFIMCLEMENEWLGMNSSVYSSCFFNLVWLIKVGYLEFLIANQTVLT